MKIAIIITGLSTGGAEWALYNLLKGGLAGKFNFHVISLIDEGTIGPKVKALGIPVSTLGMRNGRPSLSSLRKLYSVLHDFEPNIIQGWMYHGNLASTLASAMVGRSALAWNIRHSLYELSDEKCMTQQVMRLNRFFLHNRMPYSTIVNSQKANMRYLAFLLKKAMLFLMV